MDSSEMFFYSLGTILAGYLFMLPAWVVSVVWNRLFSKRAMNPWFLPLITSVVVLLLAVIGTTGDGDVNGEVFVVGFGLAPAVVWCFQRWRKHKQAVVEASL